MYSIIPNAAINMLLFNEFKELYISNFNKKPSDFVILGSATFSGIVAQFFTYPFNVIGKRLQFEGMRSERKFNGFFECGRFLYRKYGVRGFFRGIIPNFIKTIPGVAVSFYVFDKSKEILDKYDN